MDEILSFVNEQVFGVWFLIGAALVFWMQAGFAMVEAGFTRAKNSGNIIMKNLMDFCIGTVMWFLIGASLMLPTEGGDIMGIIGTPGFSVFIMLTSVIQDLYSTWYSVLRPPRSYPVPWRRERNFPPTVCIPLSYPVLSIR